MTTVRELHNQHNLTDTPIELYLVHKFDTTIKSWKFDGYRCVHCDSGFKNTSSINKHKNVCRVLNKTTTRSYGGDNPKLVLTTEGTVWKPIDLNTI